LLWKEWGDEVIVFNQDSGITHLISPIAGKVLRFIETSPATAAETNNLLHQAQGLLENLNELGLFRPSPH
jgi:hypothetical protein